LTEAVVLPMSTATIVAGWSVFQSRRKYFSFQNALHRAKKPISTYIGRKGWNICFFPKCEISPDLAALFAALLAMFVGDLAFAVLLGKKLGLALTEKMLSIENFVSSSDSSTLPKMSQMCKY
jgi:hypothetical protein